MKDEQIVILDAMPAIADVLSGETPRPEPFSSGVWWHWAIQTHAGRRALDELGIPIDPEQPWLDVVDADGHGCWSAQPWANPGEKAISWPCEATTLRELIEPNAGLFYVEHVNYGNGVDFTYDHKALIAINEDGTRAGICRV